MKVNRYRINASLSEFRCSSGIALFLSDVVAKRVSVVKPEFVDSLGRLILWRKKAGTHVVDDSSRLTLLDSQCASIALYWRIKCGVRWGSIM